jgi:hypothetical protein
LGKTGLNIYSKEVDRFKIQIVDGWIDGQIDEWIYQLDDQSH